MLEAIAKRCSVRAYTGEPVAEEELQQVLEAALAAPSANNVRPWHIVVVTDESTREKLAQVHQWAGFCAQSPVVLVFCADAQRQPHWWIEDTSAAVENALIQATALGLGTCWIGIRGGEDDGGHGPEREEYVRAVLDLPEHIRVLALVTLGHPAAESRPKPAGPMTAIHREAW